MKCKSCGLPLTMREMMEGDEFCQWCSMYDDFEPDDEPDPEAEQEPNEITQAEDFEREINGR